MKKALTILTASIAVAMILFGCNKEAKPAAAGDEIVFGAINHEKGTKAQYSGQGQNVDGQDYERIDWQSGDKVRIVCPQASEPLDRYLTGNSEDKYEDYTVTNVSASGASSSASLTHPAGSIGVRWGSNTTHYFYSMYPCPGTGVTGVDLIDDGSIKAKCIIPATQAYVSLNKSDGNYVATLDTRYLYLLGYASATPTSGLVQMEYNPAYTAFEITVQNDFASGGDMTVAKAGLVTEGDVYLTGADGQYQVKIDGDLGTNDVTVSAGSKEVMMNFSEGSNQYITIAHGKTLTFTVLAQPGGDISKLSFKMIDANGAIRTSALKYRSATETDWVNFKAFHKSRIKGLMAPESSKWYINLGEGSDITLDGWDTWKGAESLNVTQITLKETTLDLYRKAKLYYSNHDDANYARESGRITSYDIKINGEYDNSGLLGYEMDSSLTNFITPSITLRDGKTYNLHLELLTSATFTKDVKGTIIVNDTSTNSWAHVDITIHYPTSSSTPYFQ